MDKSKMTGAGWLIVRLAVISLIVGVVLSALGITPANLFQRLNIAARHLYDMGFGTLETVLQYVLVGAMVVVPIWLVAQVLSGVSKSRR